MKLLVQHLKICIFLFSVIVTSSLIAQDPYPGTVLDFDGVDDYVEVNYSPDLNPGQFTVSCWVKLNGGQNSYRSPLTSRGNFTGYMFYADNLNNWSFWVGDTTSWKILSGDAVILNQWTHLCGTYDGNNLIFYINGELSSSLTSVDFAKNTLFPLRIGAGYTEAPAGFFFPGQIEEVRIWNVARSAQEIRENTHITLSGIENGLVSYWQFNEAAADTAYDPVGGNDGALYNMDAEDWITSTVPAGGGSSYTQIIDNTGVFDFNGTGLSMDFSAKTGTDTMVVSRLDLAPNIVPSDHIAFDSQYWVVNKFGSGTFTADLTFTPSEVITAEDETSPAGLGLFSRASNSDSGWTNIMGASTASVSNNTATFDTISTFNQFLISKQWFSDINAGLTGVDYSSVAWGDYDNDGDLDILLTGYDGSSEVSRIYRNESGVFTDINAGLPGIYNSSVAWGDYDNDGDLDILLTGSRIGLDRISRIYRNDSGTFSEIDAQLTGVWRSSAAWGDYDNDGDLDILLTGDYFDGISRIYRNDAGVFTDIEAGLTGIYTGSVAWGDYDNDGDLDILLTGWYFDGSYHYVSRIYRNDAGVFSDINAGLTAVGGSSVAWGDYDNDGDLDILLTGYTGSSSVSKIYRNDAGVFTDINAGLIGVTSSSVAWGDFDNDGDLDILLTGRISSNNDISRIYRNDSGIFSDINAGLTGIYTGSVAWGDYDNDGDLDILLSGQYYDGSYHYVSRIYRNNCPVPNSAPLSPDGLRADIYADSVAFSWNKAIDNETLQDGLSYNLMIGNSELDVFINSPMADISDGYRYIPAFGNTCQRNSWTLKVTYNYYAYPQVIAPDYWGVQTIDHAFAGSPFAKDSIDIPISFLPTINNNIMQLTDLLSWEIQFGDSITSYQVQIDEDSTFASCEVDDTLFVSISGTGYYAIPLQDLSGSSSLVAGTKYYWRMKPNYTFGLPTAFTKPVPHFHFMYISFVDKPLEDVVPKEFALNQNYPNPFNPSTKIKYEVPKQEKIKIKVFNLLGQRIKTLINKQMPAGLHQVEFTAKNLPSGVYYYKINAGKFQQVKKMLLLK